MTAKYRALNLIMAIVMAMGLVFTASPPLTVKAEPDSIIAGDIAIIGFDSDSKVATFVTLVNLAEGEVIRFTDDGWTSGGAFRFGEGGITYTVPSGGIPAGTVASGITPFNSGGWGVDNTGLGSGGFNLSTSGDQIIAFQGNATSPALIAALNGDNTDVAVTNPNTDGWQLSALDSNTSALPTGLTAETNAVGLYPSGSTEYDDAHYDCSKGTSGTKSELLALINNRSNWLTSDTTYGVYSSWSGCPLSFTVTSGDLAPTVTSTVPTNTATDVAVDATLTVNFSEPVTASGTWATLSCGGPDLPVTLGGSGSTYTITPDSPYMPYGASCTATIVAAQISDQDTNDPPDTMASDYVWGFTTITDLAPTVIDTNPYDGKTGVGIASNITITFSENVNYADGFADITCVSSGTHTYGTDTSLQYLAILLPDVDFANNEVCTVTIDHTKITDQDGTPDNLASDYVFSFTTVAADAAPTVVSTVPINSSSDVAADTNLTITFSEPVTLTTGFASILCDSGTHTYVLDESADPVIVLNPDSDFTRGESCTATIDHTKVYDEDGTPTEMEANFSWLFFILPPDAAPTVSSTVPTNGATGVALDANVTINFTEAVDVAADWVSINCDTSGTHAVLVSGGPTSFTVNPDVNFSENEHCLVNLYSSHITDQDMDDPPDNMAADYSWGFTSYDDPSPSVSSVSPVNNYTGTEVNQNLVANFSEAVTVADGGVTLSCGTSGSHTVVVTPDSSTPATSFTIDPDADFVRNETCTATLESTLITDSIGQQLSPGDYSWSFKTVTPIGVARAAGAGWTGTIKGNVTVLPGMFQTNSFAVQDDTGGIYVFPPAKYTMALGDVVKVTGVIALYSGHLEFDSTSFAWISSGTPPAPEITETNPTSVAATQGKLIQVEGQVTIPGTPPAPGTTYYQFYVDDGSGQLTAYAYKGTNIDMRSFVTGQTLQIIGLSSTYNTTIEILPRFQADIMAVPPEVTGTVPLDETTGVSPYLPISATFNNPMDPDSFAGNFTLTGPSGDVSGTIGYDTDTLTATFTPDAHLEGNASYTADLGTGITDSFGIALSQAYSWNFTTGELDTSAPSITGRYPGVDDTDIPLNANVTVTFDDLLSPASIDLAHFTLTGPYGPVNASVTFDTGSKMVTFNPTLDLLPSASYSMTVSGTTENIAGIPMGSDETWSFTTGLEPTMHVYFGDLHNHTSYSDGSGTPTQALATGKAAGFDFMAITDHSYAIDDTEWANTLTAVNAATTSDFVAIRGFEYTQGAEGHINVYNTVRHAVRSNTGCAYCDYTPNLEAGVTVNGFYNWMASTGTVGINDESTLMQFNHPGWINFNDWYYHPEINALPLLEEVGNGSGSSYVFSEAEFIRSLDYGWKVGATNNADTHSLYWGTNTDDRTGVVMAGLTKADLLDALRARRTFATEDKNASLTMKANGYWMGSEIANTGTIQFVITGSDADSEYPAKVELITDQGMVTETFVPITSTFTWEPIVPITTGVHYFYVKVTQYDGDRIVSSPVWTTGSEDIAITDLTIQPTLPTTHNASLLTVRVTNRVTDSRTVHVTLSVNGLPVGSAQEVVVAGNADGYAIFNWLPTATGTATITAEITDAPAGDNPDDNSSTLVLDVSDEWLPLILIDASHANENATGAEMKPFMNDLADHGFNVLKNLDALTVEDLDPAVVKLLIITAPQTAYSTDEMTAIGNYVAAGGNLWLLGLADYTSSGANPWATLVANRENDILARIETVTGQNINMRMNDDEIIDGDDNNGYIFGVSWRDFPSTALTGIGLNVETISTWSMNSIVDRNYTELTAADTDVMIIMQGDMDEGYTSDSYHDPFHTANEDASPSDHDGFIYNPTWVYPATQPVGAVPVPGAAAVQLTGGAGRIMLYGDSNDPFTIFSYTAGDGKQNELFNLESVLWLLGEPLQKSTIAEARAQATPDQPDNLNKVVWVEGYITAAYGEFFNVLYVQDDTGGITVHAPAGDIDPSAFTRGAHVRAVGTVGIYEGDTEIEFFEAEMVQVIDLGIYNPAPLLLTTVNASLESNQGWLTVVSGTVLSKTGSDTLIIDDGSGPVRVFLDGYNGSLEDIHVMDQIQVTGLISEDGSGTRIRVRNHNFHEGVPDDVVMLSLAKVSYFPFVGKNP